MLFDVPNELITNYLSTSARLQLYDKNNAVYSINYARLLHLIVLVLRCG